MRRIPWVALGLVGAALCLRLAALIEPLPLLLPACAFKRFTGWACLTCGLTRCTVALGRGDWTEAFHWHPVAAACAALLPLAALWDLRRAWRGEAYPELPNSRVARTAAWGALLGTWALQAMRGI